ncbi:hypothetical protein HDV06_002712 [Boothiomyces sp. JEL0866]|nr:hypothetical protein HDV06_002712 [Boothiomyces sp. JEL0866]
MEFDFDTLIESLHDHKSQKQVASNILECQYTSDIVPSDFNFTKEQIGYLSAMLKTGSVQVIKAAMYVLTLVVDIVCGFQTSRIDMITSGGLLQQIIDNAVPLLLVQKEKSLELGLIYLKFIHALLKASENVSRKIINSEDPIFNALVVILEASTSDPTYVELACRMIKTISEYQSLRSVLRVSETDIVLMELLKTDFAKNDTNIFYISKAITNITVHNEECKLHLLRNGILEPLTNLLPIFPSLMVKLYAQLLPDTDAEIKDKEMEQVIQTARLIVSLFKETKQESTMNEYLFAISRFSKYSFVLQLVDLFDWLIDLPVQTESSLFVLANMTFHDKNESLKKHYKNLIAILWKALNDEKLSGNALAVLVNLAFSDKESQKICSEIGPDLFPQLFKLSENPNETIARTSLQCIRNLCIDDEACTTIQQVGLGRMFETVKQRKPDLRIETFQIIRNIFLISPDCFDKIYRQICFIPELVSSLSQTPELQKCALDIIEFLIDKKQDNYRILLLDCGVQSALLDLISKNSVYKKQACGMFVNLKSFKSKFLDCDIWKTVLRQWDEDDKKYARKRATVKPKKKKKK